MRKKGGLTTPNWLERKRRKRQITAKDMLSTVDSDLKALEAALQAATGKSERFLLTNQILRAKKRSRDLGAELASLERNRFARSVGQRQQKIRERNRRRDATPILRSNPFQGGAPQ